MSLATLFGKLQKHEMELQRLNQNEETDKRKRSIALKASLMCHHFLLFLNPFCHHFNYLLALIVKLIMQFYHLGLLE